MENLTLEPLIVISSVLHLIGGLHRNVTMENAALNESRVPDALLERVHRRDRFRVTYFDDYKFSHNNILNLGDIFPTTEKFDRPMVLENSQKKVTPTAAGERSHVFGRNS
ncbi:hypothetical protein Fmac_004674 [Flemingia macrophylla]|uniref:Uncharacterized protein n=1 Tax=Flemingia macrophylla TaxID=520843 RepID=A0ABD1N5L6_9FABA